MNVELRNIEYRRVVAGLRPAFYLMGGPSTGSGWLKSQWFLVDKLVAGGLDDWEVKIADFVVLLGKNAKKVRDAANRAKGLWGIRFRCRKRCLTPLIPGLLLPLFSMLLCP
jgi:hypothetical protein